MECECYKIPETIPREFADVTSASVAFYKLVNTLDQLEGEGCIKEHTLIATTLGYLVEFHDGKVIRSNKLPSKHVTKIVVHHEFQPLQLFIVLLFNTHKAVILSYNDFKTVNEWEDICDICSEDTEATGVAQLMFSQLSGDIIAISRKKLLPMSDDQHPEEEKGRSDAVEALGQRLKSGIRHVQQLNSQRRMMEKFIAQKLLTLQSQLKGLHDPDETKLMAVLTIEGDGQESKESRGMAVRLGTSHLKILDVKHKIVHDKWVIGLNVINDSER
ncbi:uncharacterized protein LOC121864091 [Homarus americanus]|uniref:uncharacterized protein LOC121864091 n=1 Tax=Homarus americanus TaxID=6706 RepID=UPI001C46C671|nr:uncharacterized protein LOC121864091 [Homarus americanus]